MLEGHTLPPRLAVDVDLATVVLPLHFFDPYRQLILVHVPANLGLGVILQGKRQLKA